MNKKVLIIGGGPSGISTSLYTLRSGLDTVVFNSGSTSLCKAEKIENYYGTGGVSGAVLFENGLKEAARLGAEIENGEVVDIAYENGFIVSTSEKNVSGDYLVLALGRQRKTVKIEGIEEFTGRGVSYCAVCDAFFYRKKAVAVYGSGKYALHEAEILSRVASDVFLLTDGKEPDGETSVKVDKRKVIKLCGGERLNKVVLEGGEVEVSGFFVALGVAGADAFARKLGINFQGDDIEVDKNYRTNIPNVYAVGDCVGAPYQVAKAVYDGMVCGLDIIKSSK